MEFDIGGRDLRYLAAALDEIGDAVIRHGDGAIVGYEPARIRMLVYRPESPGKRGKDISLDTAGLKRVATRIGTLEVAHIKTSGTDVNISCGSRRYKLRALRDVRAETIPDDEKMKHSGTVKIPGDVLRREMNYVEAAGSHTMIISAEKSGVFLRGDGGHDVKVELEGESSGLGYSRLTIGLLKKCLPSFGDLTIGISPKTPTRIAFDRFTYWQGGAA